MTFFTIRCTCGAEFPVPVADLHLYPSPRTPGVTRLAAWCSGCASFAWSDLDLLMLTKLIRAGARVTHAPCPPPLSMVDLSDFQRALAANDVLVPFAEEMQT